MKKTILSVICLMQTAMFACSETVDTNGNNGGAGNYANVSERNIVRSMELVDAAVPCYFAGSNMSMARYYNPYTGTKSSELGSVWMYSSAIEAVNAILHGLQAQKANGNTQLYDKHFNRYVDLLSNLYESADFYTGTFTLVSYTQTKEWTVYGVDRGSAEGTAEVAGIKNVYDDQQWLIRELIEAYRLTKDKKYLDQAEYLTDYVLDGWDCTLDNEGNEVGGIPWGPGYSSKHSCSNGPMVSPMVWLHELYKDKADQITYGYIGANKARLTKTQKKSDYYLEFAKKIYAWQNKHLKRSDNLYYDATWGPDIAYETIEGVRYRKSAPMTNYNPGGNPLSYNSGSMLSGAADLYRVTKDASYLADIKVLSDKSFSYFAKEGVTHKGYYTYDISGFNNWFNGVLMRAYVDAYAEHKAASAYLETFQNNLDYAYDNHRYNGLLPTNLLVGWNRDRGKNNTEGMFIFTFAAEYALLSQYELSKD